MLKWLSNRKILIYSMIIEAKEESKKTSFLGKIFNYLIIVFIGIFIYFMITDRAYFFSGVSQILGLNRNKVVYESFTISFSSNVGEDFRENVKDLLQDLSYDGIKRFVFVEEDGNIQIGYELENTENSLILFSSYMVPVGHLYWIEDEFNTSNDTVYVQNEDDSTFISTMTDYSPVVVEDLANTLEEEEDIPAFIPIEDLSYDYKLLTLDGNYFLDDISGGIDRQLLANINSEEDLFILSILENNIESILPSSYDEDSVAKVNMTGVTAIARDLAAAIESSGDYEYPAENIGEFLADADLTHTSNEVSFVDGCTPSSSMTFCSAPEYLATLLASGIDIVELTGNHNNDYGASNNTSTIQTYIDNGIDYFGGGLDDDDASEILYKEVGGTKIAFIGYNYYDTMLGTGAIASDTHAGANSYSESKMASDIVEAKENADIVIVDFQFQECYSYPDTDRIYPICYQPLSSPDQEYTFRLAIEDGADIVIGTQAHQPQTYELYEDGIIFYGLGNLYFDQTPWIGTRQGMILTHYFIDGVHVQTKITPTIYDDDMQTRLATEEEGDLLLELLLKARE